jgi:hypothetical protein
MKKSDKLSFEDAFNYPFNRMKGCLNIFWLLFPIFGWFALGGYSVRIVKEFSAGKFTKLPMMNFGSDMKLGFFMLLKAIPFIVAYVLIILALYEVNTVVGFIFEVFIGIFMLPILFIHFMNKQTVGSLFEFGVTGIVFDNLGDYLYVMLKSIVLGVIYLLMIIILVGLPALFFTKSIFLADFYRRRVK